MTRLVSSCFLLTCCLRSDGDVSPTARKRVDSEDQGFAVEVGLAKGRDWSGKCAERGVTGGNTLGKYVTCVGVQADDFDSFRKG